MDNQSPTKVSCKGVGLWKFPKELGQGIKYLELSNNFIQNLSGSNIPGFGQLEYLDVCFNQLESVNIEVLDLSVNNLESHMASWHISSLTSLRVLDLSRNTMTKLLAGPFQNSPRLRQLNLSNNYIMAIQEGAFEPLEELEVLNLALNSLHCISGFSLTQLEFILLHKKMQRFNRTVRPVAALTHMADLDLSNNRLELFPFSFFHSLGSLHSLSLARNCLQDMTRESVSSRGNIWATE
ncbi:hypothetical protein DUI87_03071 [Hirundo rustica rustica]|uniref:Uncharacterized protein n=1 Tax=Hirundo rustica rustica TaxID=333673 RepID=A0A3M0LT63_HIRRU|nr:hypothetical protein DUI87_03071 [Hirundo rustica rustica]